MSLDLEAIINEILRMAGTAGAISRMAIRDTTVLGKAIPKGTSLYLPLALVANTPMEHTAAHPGAVIVDSNRWKGETLSRFDPDRWLDGEGRFDGHVGTQSLPFAAGLRGCFGKSLAVSIAIQGLFPNAYLTQSLDE
jgi:cytochrome P450